MKHPTTRLFPANTSAKPQHIISIHAYFMLINPLINSTAVIHLRSGSPFRESVGSGALLNGTPRFCHPERSRRVVGSLPRCSGSPFRESVGSLPLCSGYPFRESVGSDALCSTFSFMESMGTAALSPTPATTSSRRRPGSVCLGSSLAPAQRFSL